MDVGCSKRPEVSPSNWIEVFRCQQTTSVNKQLGVKVQYLEHYHHIRIINVLSELVDDKIFVPVAVVDSLNSQIVHFGAHRHKVIWLNAGDFLLIFAFFTGLRWDDLHHVGALSIRHTWSIV